MGRKDLPLLSTNPDDFKKAVIKINNFKPTALYHSPLLRVKQTKDLILDLSSNFEKVVECPELIERDFGDFEGRIKSPANRKSLEECSSVEPVAEINKRIKLFLKQISKEDKNVLVIGHSSYFKALCGYIQLPFPQKSTLDCCNARFIEF